LNITIYLVAYNFEPVERLFAECARNSARTSTAINLILLLLIGHFGLKKIYHDKAKFKQFSTLIILFTVNHLIHFFFVYNNFKRDDMDLNISDNLHGFVTFLCLIALPMVVIVFKRLNFALYFFLLLHFFNLTYFIGKSFYARYKPGVDEAYLHRFGILVMAGALLYIVYRVFVERGMKMSLDVNQVS
jgi:hypothetical protein